MYLLGFHTFHQKTSYINVLTITCLYNIYIRIVILVYSEPFMTYDVNIFTKHLTSWKTTAFWPIFFPQKGGFLDRHLRETLRSGRCPGAGLSGDWSLRQFRQTQRRGDGGGNSRVSWVVPGGAPPVISWFMLVYNHSQRKLGSIFFTKHPVRKW